MLEVLLRDWKLPLIAENSRLCDFIILSRTCERCLQVLAMGIYRMTATHICCPEN